MSTHETKHPSALGIVHIHNGFQSKRAILWLGGIVFLIVGFLLAAVVLPLATPTPGAGGPDIHVPKMQNVPSDRAPSMKLELEEKK